MLKISRHRKRSTKTVNFEIPSLETGMFAIFAISFILWILLDYIRLLFLSSLKFYSDSQKFINEILLNPMKPIRIEKQISKLKRFKTKYTELVNDKTLPPCDKYIRINLNSNEYLKLYMQNNPVHDNDREKATSIVENLVPYSK